MSDKKQYYHLEPPAGLLNDPNGLCWYRGKYRVFFQWNRLKKDHSYKEWGLFTSENLTKWQFEGSTLIPEQDYDRDGVYSGSGQVIDGRLHLYYTGNRRDEDGRVSSQCLAVTEDGLHCQKEGVVFHTPGEYTGHFRDPKVFRGTGADYFMVIGGQRRNLKGSIALCRSADGRRWEDQGTLAVSDQYEMIECPDLFLLDGQWVLLYNPQKRNTETDKPEFRFSAYKLGRFEEHTGKFKAPDLDTDFGELDAGFDFYAPQTLEAPDGRRILFAWMSGMDAEQEAVFGKDEPNIHCLTMPRELFIRNGKLCQRPARELYGLLGQKIKTKEEEEGLRGTPDGRAFFLKLNFPGADHGFQAVFQDKEAALRYVPEEKKLIFSRRSWIRDAEEIREVGLDRLEEVEIWSDQSSMEIFVNGGETVLSARIFPGEGPAEIRLSGITGESDIQLHEIIKSVPKQNDKQEENKI